MKKLSRELDLKKHIVFIPSVDYFFELPNYLKLADIAVAPKLHSPQSHLKLVSYMAAGLPTVAFNIPINKIFLGDLGIFPRQITSQSLAESIILAIDRYKNDSEFKSQIRERACNLFSLKRLAHDLNRVYHEAIFLS